MRTASGSNAPGAALLGRSGECAAIEGLRSDARDGRSGALVIRGEPGSGKTSLLDWAVARADGMTVLRARGVESESELPFSGLTALLGPVVDLRESLPAPQSAALAGALAIGPPLVGGPFTAYAATLSLLAAAAEGAPLLVVVDDSHWLDSASLEALVFCARRMRAEGIVMLFATRAGERTALNAAGLSELALVGLDLEAAAALVERTAGAPVDPAVAQHLHESTAGNPLALIELAALLNHDQLVGRQPLEDPLPAAEAIQQRFTGRSALLPAATRAALVVCAASDRGDMGEIDTALGSMGLHPGVLEAAEIAGLIAATADGWEFPHPLVRSAVYRAVSGPERRAAHMALARALSAEVFPDRHAWHLASGTLGPDEQTAAALETSAVRARDRGGYVAAAAAFERAARLSLVGEQRARRLLEAATALEVGGRPGSTGPLLDEALATTHDPVLRAAIHYVRGRVLVFSGDPAAAQRLLAEQARAVRDHDPALATSMLCSAGMSCFMSGNIDLAVEVTREALTLGRRAGGVAGLMAGLMLGEALLLRGERDEAEALLVQMPPIAESQGVELLLAGIPLTAQCWIWLEQYGRGRELLETMIALARAQSAVAALPFIQSVLSELDFRMGRWTAAYAGATEAIELADQIGQENILAFSLVCLARVEAAWGLDEDCRAHVSRALALVKRLNANSLRVYSGSVLGLLELGLGRAEAAIAELEKVRAIATSHGLGEPAAVQWCPDLIEAYIHAGDADRAKELLGAFEVQASRTRGHWAAATASRCRGMLADDSHFEAEFHHAVTLHQLLPTPFELARTQLCIGERRRRAGRRTAARDALRDAGDTFDALYAGPWAQRARHEHNATGETPRRRHAPQGDRLTPQELRVALVVANGATTRETASQLFLSPKTIEFHLGNIYRKLDVRSRTELARHSTLTESPRRPTPSSNAAAGGGGFL